MVNWKWDERWVENFLLFFLVIGFMIAVLLFNPVLSYVLIFLTGFMAARIYYIKHAEEPIFPFILLILGFVLGYLIGGFWISRILALIMFAVGFGVSYYLHMKKILVTFKSEDFVK
tara:strand:- start:27 stop:374 length:348 start_codon:yes stop_codon:yes gene_type:complete